MSSYTMTLKEVLELLAQDEAYDTNGLIENGRKYLFDFNFPIFDENYRDDFETHFIRRFYMREIGFETEGLFKFNLETWLLINMPYFNKLFQSELLQFDPLENSNTTTDENSNLTGSDHTSSTTGSDSTMSSSDSNFSRNLESNNPDSRLTITAQDGVGVIEYASKIDENKETNARSGSSHTGGNNDANSTTATNTTTNTTRHGKTGVQTYSKMVTEYRETFLRIENKIFDEMNQLFMLVY